MSLPLRAVLRLGGVLVVAALRTPGVAVSASDGTDLVKAQDGCEAARFNAAIGPDTFVGDGRTTFDDFNWSASQLGPRGMGVPEGAVSRQKGADGD